MFPWILLVTAQAQTVHSVPYDFATVQGAILAAASGDIIEIDDSDAWERVLDQNVEVGKDLTLRGMGGRPLIPRLFVNNGATVHLEQITLTGVGRPGVLDDGDSALEVFGATVYLDGVDLVPSPFGWGILAADAGLHLEDVHAEGHWGSVVTASGSELSVNNSTFVGNTGGVIVATDSPVTVTDSSFEYNWALVAAADIAVQNTAPFPLTIDNSTFSDSAASQAGSIFAGTADLVLTNSAFSWTSSFANGGALAAWGEHAPTSVLIEDTTFEDSWSANGGAVVLVETGPVTVSGGAFRRNGALNGGALHVVATTATIQSTTFEANTVGVFGGALLVGATPEDYGTYTTYPTFPYPPYYTGYTGGYPPYGGTGTIPTIPTGEPTTADLIDVSFVGTPNVTEALIGGCLYGMPDTTITLTGGSFTSCGADLDGGAIDFDGALLDIGSTRFVENHASWWGGAIAQQAGVLVVKSALFEQNVAANGAAVRTVDTHAEIRTSAFTRNVTTTAGTVELIDAKNLVLGNNRWCHNVIQGSGAVVKITGASGDPYVIQNNVWMANTSDLGAALKYLPSNWLGNVGPQVAIHNNTLVANDLGKALSIKGQLDVRNNILAGHPVGLVLEEAAWNNALTGGYNLWASLASKADGTEGAFPTDTALLDVDPMFQRLDVEDCASNLWLAEGSPARDAGDPNLSDPDGSRSDVGAYGGPGSSLKDGDADGWLEDLDCDDTDPLVFPGQVDIPYDGIDGDCDGADLCDGDGDGFDDVACGGTDCDDSNPDVHPGLRDVLDDGLDNDCDGFERTSFLAGGGCACDGGGGGGSALWVVGLLGLGWRRRNGHSSKTPRVSTNRVADRVHSVSTSTTL